MPILLQPRGVPPFLLSDEYIRPGRDRPSVPEISEDISLSDKSLNYTVKNDPDITKVFDRSMEFLKITPEDRVGRVKLNYLGYDFIINRDTQRDSFFSDFLNQVNCINGRLARQFEQFRTLIIAKACTEILKRDVEFHMNYHTVYPRDPRQWSSYHYGGSVHAQSYRFLHRQAVAC